MRVSTLDHLISINLMYLCRRKYACVVAVLFFEAEPTAKKKSNKSHTRHIIMLPLPYTLKKHADPIFVGGKNRPL